MRWFVVAILVSWGSLVGIAEDRVTLVPEGAVDPVILIGSVEDLTGEVLVLKRPGQPVSDRYAAESVQSIQTWRTEIHLQGNTELEAGKNALAEQSFLKALQEESRDWMKREVLSQLVRCAIRRGDWSAAAARFLQIANQDSTSPHWNVAPLYWAPHSMGDSQKALARTWLKETDASPRLLATSWILLDPLYGDVARRQLDDLARNSNRIVSGLARAQLWRIRLGLEVSELEIQKWRKEVRRMPRSLRAGPQYLVGRGLLQRNEPGAAAAELLWLSTVYTDNEDLSARAMVEAASSLDKTGQVQDSLTLYNQVIERFEWSSWANEARAARSVLSSTGDSEENVPVK